MGHEECFGCGNPKAQVRAHTKPPKNKACYFTQWTYCPKCHHMQLDDDNRVFTDTKEGQEAKVKYETYKQAKVLEAQYMDQVYGSEH